ncbi:Metallo-hydrolase/oxidoreductase superfamily protein [Hirschfeldia incana]|nr:Metallo-hydrolase/oxidoreductase superfamily protein [Hirschfeldia incana]
MENNGIDNDRTAATALIFLGTGCSGAVPDFRCLLQPSDPPCHVCSQSLSLLPHLNPNYRCNTSLLIDYCCEEEDGRHYYIIIDVGKSFREQVLRWFTSYKIPRIDSIILTHEHADAILGLDDIRSFQPRGSAIDTNPLPVFLSQFTMESISTRFPYLVEKKVKQVPRRVSQLDWRIIEEDCDKPFIASGLSFTPLPVMHGEDYVALGFLFGHKSKVAYISDVSRIPQSTEYAISKAGAGQLDLLILDTNIPFKRGLQPTHICFPEALEIIKRLCPKRALLTGMTHDFDHHEYNEMLAEWSLREGIHVQLAHDGLRLPINL